MRITVSDANDEYPQFQEDGYVITLSESAPPNTHVVDVNATDGDQAGVCDNRLQLGVELCKCECFYINFSVAL